MGVGRFILGLAMCFVSIGGFFKGDTVIAVIVLIIGLIFILAKRGSKTEPVKPDSSRVASDEGLTFAREYFDDQWKKYLHSQGSFFQPDIYFFQKIGMGYDQLSVEERKKMILSSLRIKSDSAYKGGEYLMKVGVEKDFRYMYKEIFDLIQQNKLTVRNILNVLQLQNRSQGEENSARATPPTKSDESILDVTGNAFKIERPSLKTYDAGVPYWKHQYVYSYSELGGATHEQRQFYTYFRSQFLKGEYFDVEGNSNYPFILLFDLLENEFKIHQDLKQLEKQLDEIGYYYPKTASYARGFLIRKMRFFGDNAGAQRIASKQQDYYHNQSESGIYWGLGGKYKTKLSLKDEEVKLLNSVSYPDNNFYGIEFCRIAIIRLFLLYIENLQSKYLEEGTTLEAELGNMADLIARKHYGFKAGSSSYKYMLSQNENEIYSTIFKHCENALRLFYDHKRKLNTDIIYTNKELRAEFENKIVGKMNELMPALLVNIPAPDEKTEIELNLQNTTRWKTKFEALTQKYGIDLKKYYSEVLVLGSLNKKNPAIENIFFEASKIISKKDKEMSLALYVHYLYYDLKSANFDNRQFAKTIQKALFKTNEQLHEFEKLVSELIQDKDLEKALEKVPKIYSAKRKKIKLDDASIKEVQNQHSGTVELLNEYLKDEYDDESTSIHSRQINNEEVAIEIVQKNDQRHGALYTINFLLSPVCKAVLDIFVKGSFSVQQDEIEVFAKSQGLFRNQLIDSINEACYETLDDLLIEEDADYYLINKDYYQRLLQHDREH